jgi:hypothetical protein
MFQTSSDTLRLPGPHTVLMLLGRWLWQKGDSLLYRYSNFYRRRLPMRRLTEFR